MHIIKEILLIFSTVGYMVNCQKELNSTVEIMEDEFISANQNVSLTFTNLHKCSCLANEVWFNGVCHENATSIQVLVDLNLSRTKVIATNVVNNVEVSEVTCPENFLNVTLPGENFALMASGQLFNLYYDLSLDFSKYCVEHFYNSDSHEVNVEVHLCLPISKVPECCPDSLYDNLNKDCHYQNSSTVSVSFKLGNNIFETETESYTVALECQNSNSRTYVSMLPDMSSVFLQLTNQGLELVHYLFPSGDTLTFSPPNYCIQVENTRILSASYCQKDQLVKHEQDCRNKVCIRKCCLANQIYDMDSFSCIQVPQSRHWLPEIYSHKNTSKLVDRLINTKFVFGNPINCEYYIISPSNEPPDSFRLLSNGSLLYENLQQTIPSHRYCIDNFKMEKTYTVEAFVCFNEAIEEVQVCERTKSILDPILLSISCVFLAITLIVYSLIPELHAKIQSKCLLSNISALLAGYICLVVIQILDNKLSLNMCVTFGKSIIIAAF